jgi:hypothetical protein
VLKLLLERLRNEITRLAAVKALASLAHSSLDLGLQHTLDASLVRGAWGAGFRLLYWFWGGWDRRAMPLDCLPFM